MEPISKWGLAPNSSPEEAIRSFWIVNTEPRPSLANLAVALAAGIAMLTFAGALTDPTAGADTHYLAIWSTAVLVALAALALPPALDLAGAAVLVTFVVWAVPAGPLRGAIVGVLLTIALCAITLRYFEKTEGNLGWAWAIPSAMAVQYLCRAERLLDPGLNAPTLITLLVLPIAVGTVFLAMQKREGTLPALLAVMTGALLVPGWSVSVTLSLLALLVSVLFRDRLVPRWFSFAAAILVILAADAWNPSLGFLLLLIVLAKAVPASWMTGTAALIASALLCLFLPSVREWSEVARLMALGPILLPALVLPSDTRRANSIQAFVLAILALRTVAGPAALAAPLALGALSLRSKAVAAQLQLLWSGVLLALVAILGGYPWLRSPALEDALALFGVEVSWRFAVIVVVILWVFTFLCAAVAESRRRFECRPVLSGGLVLVIAAWAALPPAAEKPFSDRTQVLSSTQTEKGIDLDSGWSTSTVVVDSYLDNSHELPTGTPVARLTLVASSGEHRSWWLRSGVETGEWAARRSDVASLTGFIAPSHWMALVPAAGSFFAQRYRAEWELDTPLDIVRLELERAENLPDKVTLAIFHLELRH
jgi:hypothetical protein